MEKFENGIFEYSDPKKTPSLVEIENAHRRANANGAEKFVVVINGEHFGYNSQKRGIFKLPKGEYQILVVAPAPSVPEEPSAPIVNEPEAENAEPTEETTETAAEPKEMGEDTETLAEAVVAPTSDETADASIEPFDSETAEEGAQVAAEDISEDNGDNLDKITMLYDENETLKARVVELEEQNRNIALESVKNQKVVQIVLEMNAKIVAALK